MWRAPARSGVARRVRAALVTAIAALRSSSAAVKAHGARKRDFKQSLNKKVRALGLKMALSSKAKDGLVVVDSLELKEAKTKALKGQFDKAGWAARCW